jgi:actin-related protein
VSCAEKPLAASPCKQREAKPDVCAQVDNKTDLEYQAGQENQEEGANEDRQQKPADGSKPEEKQPPEGAAGEEEQQQDVPEQVLQSAVLSSQCAVPSRAAHGVAVLCSSGAWRPAMPFRV